MVDGRTLCDESLEAHNPDGMIYVIPRLSDTVLGGISEVGNECLTPDEPTSTAILGRCAHYFPELRHCTGIVAKVGLRPGRSAVRLEFDSQDASNRVIHCYGHGGSGMSLSWGCARAVLALARRSSGRNT